MRVAGTGQHPDDRTPVLRLDAVGRILEQSPRRAPHPARCAEILLGLGLGVAVRRCPLHEWRRAGDVVDEVAEAALDLPLESLDDPALARVRGDRMHTDRRELL